MFSISLVTLDSYQSAPISGLDGTFSDFRGTEIKHVPVIRIFGSTSTGKKTCLHVHGAFPYIYVPCTVEENVDSFAYRLAASIDSAINSSFGATMSSNQHVYKIQRVSGIPFYGYHEKEHLFFKIYFYNPAVIKRAAELLQNGAVLNQGLQPHEAHIPFVLQFMIDYNLYGMSRINLRDIKYRRQTCSASEESFYSDESSDSQRYLPITVSRQSMCELEIDAKAVDILNRQAVEKGLKLNPGIAGIWEEEKLRRQEAGLEKAQSQLLYPTSPSKVILPPTEYDIYQEERLASRLQMISQETEEAASTDGTSSTYPLEVRNEENLLTASRVLDHTESLISEAEKTRRFVSYNEKIGLEPLTLPQTIQHQETASDSTVLDADDAQLLDLLVDLAEDKVNEKNERHIDDDSVLGSQYSGIGDQVKNDHDDEDLDDLNLTSLDLDSLSSWESVKTIIQKAQQPDTSSNLKEPSNIRENIMKEDCDDMSSLKLSQCDGADDLLTPETIAESPKKREHKRQRKKLPFNRNSHKFHNETMIKTCQLDHNNLDVYDADEIEVNSTDLSTPDLNTFEEIEVPNKQHDYFIKSAIPALDGDTIPSSSDSEIEQDITMERQEKRICVYKSSTKAAVKDRIITTPRRRRRLIYDEASKSPGSSKKSTSTLLQSPQCSRSYTPLKITVTSPKVSSNSKTSQPSGCDTPKRGSLLTLRKSHRENASESSRRTEATGDKLESPANKNNSVDATAKKADEECNSAIKNTKEVRKRLDFTSIDEAPGEEEGLKGTELSQSKTDDAVSSSSVTVEVHVEENTAKPADKTQWDETEEIAFNSPELNEALDFAEDSDEAEENLCNMTFTQYVNKKIEADNLSFSQSTSTTDRSKKNVVKIIPKFCPPDYERIEKTMMLYDIPKFREKTVHFSNKLDHKKHRESSGRNSCKNSIPDLSSFKCSLERVTGIKLWRRMKVNEFYPSGSNIKSTNLKRTLAGYKSLVIRPLMDPPTVKDVKDWLRAKEYLSKKEDLKLKEGDRLVLGRKPKDSASNMFRTVVAEKVDAVLDAEKDKESKKLSQNSDDSIKSYSSSESLNPSLRKALENPLLYKTDKQRLGVSFGQIDYSLKEDSSGSVTKQNMQNARMATAHEHLMLFSLEIHIATRGDLLPDPQQDPIEAIFYAIQKDALTFSNVNEVENGIIMMNSSNSKAKLKHVYSARVSCPLTYVKTEEELIESFLTIITKHDPDILLGWEIETLSWGYVLQRAIRIGFKNLLRRISRVPYVNSTFEQSEMDDTSELKIPGRIVLNVWRIMRHEAALLNYTFENVMFNVMRERFPCPSFKTLTEWWRHANVAIRDRAIEHYVIRVLGTLRILSHLDVIGRTCEHARLFGIQFYEVFSRGSQFRVESMMLRLAKPLNYIAVSSSIQQRANMRAPEWLPLIMEPESTLYVDPLIVLDFQSLYPSMIIAYNYCFSTCLGRVEHIGQNDPFEFGITMLRVRKKTALELQGKINFAPCGVAYIKPEIRRGILPRMLSEILNTRLMVKESMKLHPAQNKVLQRVLHSQQLGLKLIANVTYGYTSANFSGRMPCIEVGDSVVSKGRETLERAIKIIENTPKWGARVVYGDTDSIFILVQGKSRAEAFKIGAEIADTVTQANPPPVKLKFEKILQPAILQTKKRYCGYMYENPDQEKPEYLAKGIETVRRDGCPAVAKILEKCLKILFDTRDLSLVKNYVTRQLDKVLTKRVSIQDLTFAKEFRGLKGYKASACVPALELTRRMMKKDPRAIPRTGERVRYVIVAGAPNQTLIQCVRSPRELISEPSLTPNSVYYITKVIIPPLNRCLNLIGIDVNNWYREMSHRQYFEKPINQAADNQKSTIIQFFNTVSCIVCGEQSNKEVCLQCLSRPSRAIISLYEKIRWSERTYHQFNAICRSCVARLDEPQCESLDCPILYRVVQIKKDILQACHLNQIIDNEINTENSSEPSSDITGN